jgi:hypothetical protein
MMWIEKYYIKFDHSKAELLWGGGGGENVVVDHGFNVLVFRKAEMLRELSFYCSAYTAKITLKKNFSLCFTQQTLYFTHYLCILSTFVTWIFSLDFLCAIFSCFFFLSKFAKSCHEGVSMV